MAGISLATAATVAGGVAAVGGTIASISAQRQAQRAAQKRADLEKQQQALATRRSRRQAIREAQIKRAQTIATAQSAGGLEGSAIAGGTGSLSSQLGESLGFSSQMSGLSRAITDQSTAISSAQTRSGLASGFAGFGSQLFNFGASRGGLAPFQRSMSPDIIRQDAIATSLMGGSVPDFTGR